MTLTKKHLPGEMAKSVTAPHFTKNAAGVRCTRLCET